MEPKTKKQRKPIGVGGFCCLGEKVKLIIRSMLDVAAWAGSLDHNSYAESNQEVSEYVRR